MRAGVLAGNSNVVRTGETSAYCGDEFDVPGHGYRLARNRIRATRLLFAIAGWPRGGAVPAIAEPRARDQGDTPYISASLDPFPRCLPVVIERSRHT